MTSLPDGRRRLPAMLGPLAALLLVAAAPLGAQRSALVVAASAGVTTGAGGAIGGAPAAVAADGARALPFVVGERLDYDARVGPLRVGSGFMEVIGREPLRGRSALHVTMRVAGSFLGIGVREAFDSWIDPTTFESLRFVQEQHEVKTKRTRTFDIFPERGTYAERGKPEEATAARPLDDGAFFYFVRTVPLRVGESYEFDRYFRPDRNPVRLRVVRRERITVPAGTFDAIVVQPRIKSKGLLGENAHTELWLTDDDRRILLKMQAGLPFGTLSLHLRSIREASGEP